MYKHTEYPSIPTLRVPSNFMPTYVQEKLDGANVRVIVPSDGSGIIFGTRKTLLISDNLDFKNFKNTFGNKLEKLALENMKPIIDSLDIPYNEFVIYGELIGPSVFSRLNYGIKVLEVFFYDLFLYFGGKRVFLPWTYQQLQEYFKSCKLQVIPFEQYTNEKNGEDYIRNIYCARSFLNSEENIEGYILRDDKGDKIFKFKLESFIEMERGRVDPFRLSLKPTEELYKDLENKYGGFTSMTPEKLVSLMVNELIQNYYEVKQKKASKGWIFGVCRSCFIKFFPAISLNKEVIDSTLKLL